MPIQKDLDKLSRILSKEFNRQTKPKRVKNPKSEGIERIKPLRLGPGLVVQGIIITLLNKDGRSTEQDKQIQRENLRQIWERFCEITGEGGPEEWIDFEARLLDSHPIANDTRARINRAAQVVAYSQGGWF